MKFAPGDRLRYYYEKYPSRTVARVRTTEAGQSEYKLYRVDEEGRTVPGSRVWLSREYVERAYVHMEDPPTLPAPRSDLRWIGFDLDGVLAVPLWTPESPTRDIGRPLWSNIAKLERAVEEGFKAVIHTARPWTDHEIIEAWLQWNKIPYHAIQCGKPLYRAYVDDRAIHDSARDYLGGSHCATCTCEEDE